MTTPQENKSPSPKNIDTYIHTYALPTSPGDIFLHTILRSYKLPVGIVEALDQYCAFARKEKSEIVTEALAKFLNMDVPKKKDPIFCSALSGDCGNEAVYAFRETEERAKSFGHPDEPGTYYFCEIHVGHGRYDKGLTEIPFSEVQP